MKRAKEVGAENVFDFSIGNPSVPAPKEIDETALRLLKTADPVDIHGYTSNAGVLEVRENIAKSLNKRFDTNYTAANIFMTIGAAAAPRSYFNATARCVGFASTTSASRTAAAKLWASISR